MHDHKWQVLLKRPNTDSTLRVDLPENLNTSLNIATFESDDPITFLHSRFRCNW